MKSIPLLVILVLMVGCGGPTKRCLVSPLSGTLVADGKPVEGAKVTRSYHSHWYNKHVEDVVRTDVKGYFEFKGAWKQAVVDVPHQPVIEQVVVVEYNGTNRTVMNLTKLNYESFGELKAVQFEDPAHGKDRLSEKEGKLYLKFDLNLEKVPIGKPR